MHFSQNPVALLTERTHFGKLKEVPHLKTIFMIFPIAQLFENVIHLPKLKYTEPASRKTLSYEKVNELTE